MTDNVIILGAGSSVEAGVPLLGNFVDQMLEYGFKGKAHNKDLSSEDKTIFAEAMKVRNELDGYHGRAAFDDRNIEDILSILAFNLMAGGETEREKLEWMTKAIARTIELSTKVKFDNNQIDKIQKVEGVEVYKNFWQKLFKRFSNQNDFPTIITFNYDLVLERSLFHLLINTHYNAHNENLFPFDGISLKYYYDVLAPFFYKVNQTIYSQAGDIGIENLGGTNISLCNQIDLERPANIELLKLHGSINFPNRISHESTKPIIPTDSVENAYILPPLPNKGLLGEQIEIWKVALERLREAKNIVIVGYSLPRTDIYMQYFFKAGLGPNVNLNKITVFNPVLFRNKLDTMDPECKAMEERYSSCFSPQLKERIVFRPSYLKLNNIKEELAGTFRHFVQSINNDSIGLFF